MNEAPFSPLRITKWYVSQEIRTGLPFALLLLIRSKIDTAHRITFDSFSKRIKSYLDCIALVL